MAQLANALLPIVNNDEDVLNEFKNGPRNAKPNKKFVVKKFGKKIGI